MNSDQFHDHIESCSSSNGGGGDVFPGEQEEELTSLSTHNSPAAAAVGATNSIQWTIDWSQDVNDSQQQQWRPITAEGATIDNSTVSRVNN